MLKSCNTMTGVPARSTLDGTWHTPTRGRLRIAWALVATYVIWGSTYLAIRYAIETIPPLLMMGTRSLLAGGILFLWACARGAPRIEPRQWVAAAITGALLFVGGHGVLSWAEQTVPSGLAALLFATMPSWMVVLESMRPGGQAAGGRTILGLGGGLVGVALLIGGSGILADDAVAVGSLVLASASWAAGSLYGRTAGLPANLALATGMKLVTGGLLLLLVGLFTGEGARIDLAAISTRSVMALLYLAAFGSIVAFTAYSWLLDVVSPAKAGSNVYVTPVIAVALGWALAGETVTVGAVAAAAVIVGSVGLIVTEQTAPIPGSVHQK